MEDIIDENSVPPLTDTERLRGNETTSSNIVEDGSVNSNVNFNQTSILENLLNKDENDTATGKTNAVDQDLQDQDNELRALGISVVDQWSLERDVEAAVDKAVTVHARKQRLQILKKEIQDVKRDIKQGDLKFSILSERLSGMRRRLVDPRQYMNVEKEMKNKDQQLKTLRSREEYLKQKLSAAEINEEELDDYELEDGEIQDEDDNDNDATESTSKMSGNEKERLIREGQMTPFGTVMTPDSSKTVSVMRPSYTQAEKKRIIAANQKKTVKGGPTKQDMISAGEMTPFGSVITATKKGKSANKKQEKSTSAMTDFEKYLQDQIDRQKLHNNSNKGVKRKRSSGDPNYGILKRRKKPKEYMGNIDFDVDGSGDASDDSTSLSSIKKKVKSEFETKVKKVKSREKKSKTGRNKDPIKMHILHPKQNKYKKVGLGSVTSELEADQYKVPPRRILSERVSFEGNDSENSYSEDESGSEYVPSANEWEENDPEEWNFKDDQGERKSTVKEKVDRPKRKRKKKYKSEDDESFDEMPKTKGKRRFSKEVDDGNIDDYVKRIERWKGERLKMKHAKILRGENLDSEEEEEEGYEEFDGGFKIPLGIWNKLYKYQRTCVKWLWEIHCQGCGGILGDEMGLGKTIQMISFLVGLSYSRLSERHQRWKGLGPVLIVCPATVLHQWVKEFHKWWPPFRVAVLHESGSFHGKKVALIHNISKYDGILITSYSGVHNQVETLLQYNWHYIILDEGHKIRNPEAQVTVAIKRFQTPHRLILSGSPIQNSLKELWSLFDFVFPGKLGTLPVFLSEFAVPITHGGYANASKIEVQTAFKCASVLRDTINPYLLRRMKSDVRDHLSLPDKNEQVLFCSLTDEQRRAYQEYLSGDQVKCIMGGRMKVFVGLINLRKICNHPDLHTGGPHNYGDYESGLQPELKYGWWGRSGKMHVLQSILRLWSKQGHRVLLFTQSRQMMCILEKFLMDEQHSYLKMDGTTGVSSRQPMIEKFNTDPSYFVFLLTTRVGGLGVNLTGADRVVIFDPDWNPSTDCQARERAWRIGQLRHVTIYRLLTSGTIEEKIYHRQIFKQFLTNRVLKDPKQQRFFKTNDLFELFTFNEGFKEKTESSAIFAGTDSEIKVNVDENAKESDDEHIENVRANEKVKSISLKSREAKPFKKQPTNKATSKRDKNLKKLIGSPVQKSQSSNHISNLERMKELAKKISQKIGKKSTLESESSSTDTKVTKPQEDKIKEVLSSGQDSSEMKSDNERALENHKSFADKSIDSVKEKRCSKNEDSPRKDMCSRNEESSRENSLMKSIDSIKEEICSEDENSPCESSLVKLIDNIKEELCSENEDSPCGSSRDKLIGSESEYSLSENSLFKSKDSIKEEICGENENSSNENSHIESIDIIKEEICSENEGANTLIESTCSFVNDLEIKKENESNDDMDNGQGNVSTYKTEIPASNSSEKHRKKHKKKDKHKEKKEKYRDKEKREKYRDKEKKRSHKKGRKIDGERIDYLVKKRVYHKTEEEQEAEKERSKSQDEYVLTKLFQKSGVHTALSHDSILSNNDPDYLLTEGEAERVAKEALKAVRASRARCFRPWSSSNEPTEPKKGKHKFGTKKNKIFTDSGDREIKKDKETKNIEKKKRMFDGGMDSDDSDDASQMTFTPKKKLGKGESSGGMSSVQLLSRIHQRNKTVGSLEINDEGSDDEDYDPDYPSTAAAAMHEGELEPEIQDNIDLLTDIRNFVAFQAEVDGSASTQEIINRFRNRLPPEQTPFFKALLKQICDFHRKTSGEGIWSLKGEFR